MASRDKAGVYDIGKRIWMDIDTPLDWKKARRLLYSDLTKPEDGWISRKINRKVSTRLFTPLILRLFKRIAPNTVSLISAGTGILAGIGFILHLPVIGAIAAQTASILDGSDGEIARLKKMQSAFGKFSTPCSIATATRSFSSACSCSHSPRRRPPLCSEA